LYSLHPRPPSPPSRSPLCEPSPDRRRVRRHRLGASPEGAGMGPSELLPSSRRRFKSSWIRARWQGLTQSLEQRSAHLCVGCANTMRSPCGLHPPPTASPIRQAHARRSRRAVPPSRTLLGHRARVAHARSRGPDQQSLQRGADAAPADPPYSRRPRIGQLGSSLK